MTFRGWTADALEFYEGLEADNTKTYWQRNREVYDRQVLAPMQALLDRARVRVRRRSDLPPVP